LKGYIVDASVGAKWVLPPAGEPLYAEATTLVESFRNRELLLLVPDLFWIEVSNALWKSIRRTKISRREAIANFSALEETRIPTFSSGPLVSEALKIAVNYDRTVYDSLYVAAAVERSLEMITADERLANALAAYFPVTWLGTFSA
jgi:predicted nucleic acid-binding protein